ncbi:MAG: hypothetical protein WAU17_10235 [Nitrospirales bacterium]
MQIISGVDFTTVELRVGRIVSAALFPVAGKPAYLLQSDFRGEIGIQKSSGQNSDLSQSEEL